MKIIYLLVVLPLLINFTAQIDANINFDSNFAFSKNVVKMINGRDNTAAGTPEYIIVLFDDGILKKYNLSLY